MEILKRFTSQNVSTTHRMLVPPCLEWGACCLCCPCTSLHIFVLWWAVFLHMFVCLYIIISFMFVCLFICLFVLFCLFCLFVCFICFFLSLSSWFCFVDYLPYSITLQCMLMLWIMFTFYFVTLSISL